MVALVSETLYLYMVRISYYVAGCIVALLNQSLHHTYGLYTSTSLIRQENKSRGQLSNLREKCRRAPAVPYYSIAVDTAVTPPPHHVLCQALTIHLHKHVSYVTHAGV